MVALIKTLMSLRGVSQVELSRLSGVSVVTLSRFLNNASELRAETLIKVLTSLGTPIESFVRKEIHKALGQDETDSIGEDIRFLMDHANPIKRKMLADTMISSFKNETSPEVRARIQKLKRYKESIKTVRRLPC